YCFDYASGVDRGGGSRVIVKRVLERVDGERGGEGRRCTVWLDLGDGHIQAQAVGAGAQKAGIADNIERRQRGLRTIGPSCKQYLGPYARRLSHGDDQRQGRRAVIHTRALSASFVMGTLNPSSRCRQHHL